MTRTSQPSSLSNASDTIAPPTFPTPYAALLASGLLVAQGLERPEDPALLDAYKAQTFDLLDVVRSSLSWLGVEPVGSAEVFLSAQRAVAADARAHVFATLRCGLNTFDDDADLVAWLAAGIAHARQGREHRMDAMLVARAVARATTSHSTVVVDTDARDGAPMITRRPGTARQHELCVYLAGALELESDHLAEVERVLDEAWPEILAGARPVLS